MGEMKPSICKKAIFLQQYDFDIIHKDAAKLYMLMHYQDIYPTQISGKKLNQLLVLFKENMNIIIVV